MGRVLHVIAWIALIFLSIRFWYVTIPCAILAVIAAHTSRTSRGRKRYMKTETEVQP